MHYPKPALTIAAVCVALVSACATEPASDGAEFSALEESGFRTSVVGKSLAYDKGGDLTFNPDGTLSGAFPDGAATGSWAWENGRVCSRTTVGSKTFDRTCRTPQMNGDRIRFLQADGSVFSVATVQ